MTFPLILSCVHNTVWIKQAQKKFKYVCFIGCRFYIKEELCRRGTKGSKICYNNVYCKYLHEVLSELNDMQGKTRNR